MQDFAFFAATFGYSKAEYEALTPAETMFLCKAYEEKMVTDSSLLAAAVANAVGNVFRKKGKRASPLWKKKPQQGSLQERRTDIAAAKEVQKMDGDRWLEQIYRANGRTFRRKEASTDEHSIQ